MKTWLQKLESSALRLPPNQRVAALDADGTLWPFDLGELFFQYEIDRRLLPKLPSHAWEHYRSWKELNSPRGAYLWLAQIHRGLSLRTVRSWAEDHFQTLNPDPFFPQVLDLVRVLKTWQFRIHIVTASVSWAIEPGARRLGLNESDVLGVSTEVVQDQVQLRPTGAITYREGKWQRLLEHTDGIPPWIAVGNSFGDEALLRGARHAVAVCSAPKGHELHENEQKLQTLARTQGWHRLDLR